MLCGYSFASASSFNDPFPHCEAANDAFICILTPLHLNVELQSIGLQPGYDMPPYPLNSLDRTQSIMYQVIEISLADAHRLLEYKRTGVFGAGFSIKGFD
jgi:hypothetical protein